MTSSGEVSPISITPSGTPVLGVSHAPKYGTVIPNRIFVGGIAANTTEAELKQFFTAFGAVKDSKIIADRAGVSKGYGFITFETQEDAEKMLKKESENLVFKDRKLNIGRAIRKQQAFPRLYEPNMSQGTLLFSNGVPYTYQNGMAIFHSQEGGYAMPAQPQAAYPVMVPHGQPMYVSQPYSSYQTAAPTQWAHSQWRWAPAPQSPSQHVGSSQFVYPMQPIHPPDMNLMYAQPPPQAYQPDITEAMIEATPAEVQELGKCYAMKPHY